MKKAHYIIRDLVTGNYWNKHLQMFGDIFFAYKMGVQNEIVHDKEFQKTRLVAQEGIELVKVYK